MSIETQTAHQLWYYWDRPNLGWRRQDCLFGDGVEFAGLPGTGTAKVRNRNNAEATLGGVALPPDRWTELPVRLLAERTADHNLHVDLSGIQDQLPTRTADGRPLLDWWGPIDAVRGYGRQSVDMWRGLRKLGVEARLHPSQYQHNAPYQAECHYVQNSVVRHARASHPPARIAVAMSAPFDPVLYQNPSPIKIAITQHDTGRVPSLFAGWVNQCTHLIVTSSFQRRTWADAGVTIPIAVLRSGVDTEVFLPVRRAAPDQFRVLILGSLTPRKNVPTAIRIFQQASAGDPTWRLTVLNRGKLDRAIKVAARDDSRVTVARSDGDPSRVRDLYQTHDCFLWPSKAEGVGLPPMEAMASGMDLVCADSSGMTDYLSNEWAWPIRCDRTVPSDVPGEEFADFLPCYGPAGDYWLVDERHAVGQLRACHDAVRSGVGKGAKAAAYIRRDHTIRAQAQSILDVVNGYL